MSATVFKIRRELLGGHVHTRVFVGPDADHLALAGELVFDEAQALAFEARLARPAQVAAVVDWLRETAELYRSAVPEAAGRPDRPRALLFVHLNSDMASLFEVVATAIEERRW